MSNVGPFLIATILPSRVALLHEWMIKEMEIVSLRDQPYKARHMTKQETKVGGKAKKAEEKQV